MNRLYQLCSMKAYLRKIKQFRLLCDDNRISVSDAPFSSEIKLLIDNYFQISDDGSQAPENQATLMLKSGFVN